MNNAPSIRRYNGYFVMSRSLMRGVAIQEAEIDAVKTALGWGRVRQFRYNVRRENLPPISVVIVPTKRRIFDLLATECQYMTRSEVVRRLSINNSSRVHQHLKDLVGAGSITLYHAAGRNALGVVYYAVAGSLPGVTPFVGV